jgi:hypothetical protein
MAASTKAVDTPKPLVPMPREVNRGSSPLAEPLAASLSAANQVAEAPVRRLGTAWAVLNAATAGLVGSRRRSRSLH